MKKLRIDPILFFVLMVSAVAAMFLLNAGATSTKIAHLQQQWSTNAHWAELIAITCGALWIVTSLFGLWSSERTEQAKERERSRQFAQDAAQKEAHRRTQLGVSAEYDYGGRRISRN